MPESSMNKCELELFIFEKKLELFDYSSNTNPTGLSPYPSKNI
jgi:hypothetical protein